MDPASSVEDTILSTDGQMDEWTDGQGETSMGYNKKISARWPWFCETYEEILVTSGCFNWVN